MCKKQRKHPFKGAFSYVRIALLDKSGNGRNLTLSGSNLTFEENYANITQNSYMYLSNFGYMQHDWTISLRINYSALANLGNASHIASIGTGNNRNALFLGIYNNTTQGQPYGSIQFAQYGEDYISSNKTVQNTWYNLIFTYNYSTRKYDMYVNGEKRMNGTFNYQYSLGSNTLYIGATCMSLTQGRIIGKIAKYIIENKKRSDSEAVDYWNKVKKKYGY